MDMSIIAFVIGGVLGYLLASHIHGIAQKASGLVAKVEGKAAPAAAAAPPAPPAAS